MKPNAYKKVSGSSVVKIGVIVRKIDTNNVKYGTNKGTLYGRGKSGSVLRSTNKQITAAP